MRKKVGSVCSSFQCLIYFNIHDVILRNTVLLYLPLVSPKFRASSPVIREGLQEYVLCHIDPVFSSTYDLPQCNAFVYGFFSGYPQPIEGCLA